MSSSNSPCAACKFLRRKCTQECVFAPYFPPDQPQKFANVHKVFGASNIGKLLNELDVNDRSYAVNSLAYEAEARLRDPIYGCVGLISILQQNLKKLQGDVLNAKQELSTYIGHQAANVPMNHAAGYNPAQGYMPQQQHPVNPYSASCVMPYNMPSRMTGLSSDGAGPSRATPKAIREAQQLQLQQQKMMEASREQQDMMRSYEQQMLIRQHIEQLGHQPQQEVAAGFNAGFEQDAAQPHFIQMPASLMTSTVLGGLDDNQYPIQQQQQEHDHLPQHQRHHPQLQTHHLLQSEQLQQENLPRHQHHHPQLQTQHLLQSEQLQLQQQENLPRHRHHHPQLQTRHLLQSEQLQLQQPHQQQEHLPHHFSQLQTRHLLQSDQLQLQQPHHLPQQQQDHNAQLQAQHLLQSEYLQLQQPHHQQHQEHLPHPQHDHLQLHPHHLLQSAHHQQQEHLPHHQQDHPQLQTQHFLQLEQLQLQEPHQQHGPGSDEGGGAGPSS